MRTITPIFLILLIFSSVPLKAQDAQSAVNYLTTIDQEFSEITNDMWTYIKVVAKGKSARKVENKRQNLISSMNTARYNVQHQKGYQGDVSYRNAVTEYLRLNLIVLKEDYGKILDLEEIAERSYDNMEAYLLAKKMAGQKLDEASDFIDNKRQEFADLYHINLVEGQTKMGQKLKRASDTFEYYNKVYLVFFKSFKQESYLIEAVSKNDLNGLEQNRSALEAVSQEGIDKLVELGDYQGDNTIKHISIILLRFYLDEAKNQMKLVSDFYLKKENMEKVRQAYDTKRKKDITQVDVDNVNRSIDEYNAALNKYNQMIQSINKNREDLIEKWNQNSERFLAKHAV